MPQTSQADRAAAFRALHDEDGVFMMPNAWDGGSAAILADGGFKAIATTSAGIAFALGKADYMDALTREENMAAIACISRVAGGAGVPVSADTESGYGPSPEDVAETMRQTIAAGAVGGSVEDYRGNPAEGLIDIEEAADRVAAAVDAANASGIDFTVTARAECYLVRHPDPLKEAIKRLNRYREAGAHCLYAPGPTDAETIATLVREVDGPINVVAGLSSKSLSIAELGALGVRRISTGGALARASMATVRQAAQDMSRSGTFPFAGTAIPDAEMNAYFKPR